VQSDPTRALVDYYAGLPLPAGYAVIADNPDPNAPNALPRPIIVRAPYFNSDALRTDGIDLNVHADYGLWRDARLLSDFNATKILSWKLLLPDGSSTQFVGTQGPYILSSGAGTPRYRASWANTVTFGAMQATATVYYVSGLYMSAPDIAPGCFSTNGTTNANVPANCRMASFTDVDLTASWQYSSRVTFSAGISNLFDRRPPLDPIDYAAANYNPTYAQAGIIGRFFKLGVNVKF
jgi:iron complex outermembrane receptor protein